MSRKVRIILYLLVASLILAGAILFEKHRAMSLVPGSVSVSELGAFKYTETASYDGLLRKDGKIYDAYSLTPEKLQLKDCPT